MWIIINSSWTYWILIDFNFRLIISWKFPHALNFHGVHFYTPFIPLVLKYYNIVTFTYSLEILYLFQWLLFKVIFIVCVCSSLVNYIYLVFYIYFFRPSLLCCRCGNLGFVIFILWLYLCRTYLSGNYLQLRIS